MRIAYLHQYYQSRDQSGGTRSYEFGRRLVDQGHEVHVITTDTDTTRPSRSWRMSEEAGMHIHWLPVPYSNNMSYPRRVLSFAQFAAIAGVRAAGVHPDVVLATSTPLTIVIPGLVATKLRRVPFVFEVRDLWPELPIEIGALKSPIGKFLAMQLAKAAYRNAARVIALSPGMAEGVIRHGYPRDRVTVVPNASDLDLFAPRPDDVAAFRADRTWLGDRPLVVYTGTFGTVNGVDYLVRLAAEVKPLNPDIRFLLVGAGAHFENVRTLAAQLDVLDQTVFVETPVPRSQLPTILRAATLATSVVIPLPGLEHNSANKFFDALAAGCPIAINHGGWQADLLNESGSGFVLNPSDIPAAARQLVRRLGDPQWLRAAGAAASTLAREQFARDRLFERFAPAVTGTVTPPRPYVVDLRATPPSPMSPATIQPPAHPPADQRDPTRTATRGPRASRESA
jgi:glycosyltransferase involved in cell wall biosynthesis